jgi:Ca-activated chloride channel family protein
LAVVSLAIALAQFRVARSKATPTIALAIDASNSMDATDVQPNRLSAAESAAQAFLQQLPPEFAVSLVSFADEPKVLVAPTTDHTQVANALGDLPRGQGTAIGDGLASAWTRSRSIRRARRRVRPRSCSCPTGTTRAARPRRWTPPPMRPIAMSRCTR